MSAPSPHIRCKNGPNQMKTTTKLKELLLAPKLLVMPSAYDAVSARLIEEAGFDAVQISGLGVAASRFGVPDVSIVSMGEMAEATHIIAQSVSIPVMGDCDTGYGNGVNTWYSVRAFEDAGAAGVNIEDQVLPKRCGRLDGKAVVSIAEMVGKVEAAVDARRDPDFVINARSDALSLTGIDDVIERGNRFLQAGATMFFVEGVRSLEEIETLVARVDGPLALNLIEDEIGAGLEDVTFDDLEKMGVARVSLSLGPLLGAMHGVRQALLQVKNERRSKYDSSIHAEFGELHALAGMTHAAVLSDRFNRS